MPREDGQFKKGDPRASEAGKKGGSVSQVVGVVTPTFMDKIRELEPEATTALKAGVEKGDPTCLRLVVERLAPKNLVEDDEVRTALKALRDENNHLVERVQQLRADLEFERATPAQQEMIRAQMDAASTSPRH